MNLMQEMVFEAKKSEMLKEYGLDFTIYKQPTYFQWDEKEVQSKNFSLINDASGKEIATCKGGYHISQNKDVLDMILKGAEAFSDKVDMRFGGFLKGGAKTYFQLEVNGIAHVGNDKIKQYITIIDSNDGSTSLGIGIGNLTMSCANQFVKFYMTSNMRIRHDQVLEEKLLQLPMAIEEALFETIQMANLYNEFEGTEITMDLADELLYGLLSLDRQMTLEQLKELSTRKKNSKTKLEKCLKGEINSKGQNLWGLFSGITNYTTHISSVPKRTNGRLESLMVGSGYGMNQKALAFCESHLSLSN
jgi:hypothetical protein